MAESSVDPLSSWRASAAMLPRGPRPRKAAVAVCGRCGHTYHDATLTWDGRDASMTCQCGGLVLEDPHGV